MNQGVTEAFHAPSGNPGQRGEVVPGTYGQIISLRAKLLESVKREFERRRFEEISKETQIPLFVDFPD